MKLNPIISGLDFSYTNPILCKFDITLEVNYIHTFNWFCRCLCCSLIRLLMISVRRFSMALILSSRLLLGTHLKAGKKSHHSNLMMILNITSTNASNISHFVTIPNSKQSTSSGTYPHTCKRKTYSHFRT